MVDDHPKAPLEANFNNTPHIQRTHPLHERFLLTIIELEGTYGKWEKVKRKKEKILGVQGLNIHHIEVHLQKCRITTSGAKGLDDMKNREKTQNVVVSHLDFPTNSVPSLNTMPTPYGMGGYEVYDGSSVQREMEGGVQQASEVEKHVMIREDTNKKYMDSMIEKACKFILSGETQSACQSHK